MGKVPKRRITDLYRNLRDNARKNSKAACLAARRVQSSLLPDYKRGKSSKYPSENQIEGEKIEETEDVDYSEIDFNKFISEQPQREYQDAF